MIVRSDDIAQATNVGVVEQSDNSSLSGGADFLGMVVALLVFIGTAGVGIIGGAPGNDLARDLQAKQPR